MWFLCVPSTGLSVYRLISAQFNSRWKNPLPKHWMKSLWEQPSSPCLHPQARPTPGANTGPKDNRDKRCAQGRTGKTSVAEMPSGSQHGGDEAFLSIEGELLVHSCRASLGDWAQASRGKGCGSVLLRDGFVSAKVNLGFWTVAIWGGQGADV